MTDQTASAEAGNAGATTAAATTATTATTTETKSWVDGLPEDLKGYALNKGWDKPDKVLTGYRQLEQFVGADKAGRGLVMPTDTAPKDEVDAFYRKLGRPDTADAYELKGVEGFDNPDYTKAMANAFLDAGLTKAQAAKIATANNAAAEALNTAAKQEQVKLQQEWGNDHAKNLELCKRGAKALGWDDAIIDAIEANPKIGFGQTMKALLSAGQKFSEGRFVESGGDGPGPFGETIEHINAQLKDLANDKMFSARWNANEPAAVQQYQDLLAKKNKLLSAA